MQYWCDGVNSILKRIKRWNLISRAIWVKLYREKKNRNAYHGELAQLCSHPKDDMDDLLKKQTVLGYYIVSEWHVHCLQDISELWGSVLLNAVSIDQLLVLHQVSNKQLLAAYYHYSKTVFVGKNFILFIGVIGYTEIWIFQLLTWLDGVK